MTVTAVEPYNRYEATAGTTIYSFNFPVLAASDLQVTYLDTNGVVTVLVKDTDYTVSLNPDKTGSITLSSAYSDGVLELRRNIPLTQDVHWINHGPFDMDVFELSQDKIIMILQQFNTTLTQGQQTSTWRGTWIAGSDYKIGDTVTDPVSGNIYVCKVANTAGSSFSADIALGYWSLTLDISAVKDSETNAAASAASAAADAATASTRAAEAADSQVAAAQSETNAAQSAANAESWATQVAQSLSTVPVGHIMPWLGGFFTNSQNGGYTDVLGDPQTYLTPFGYRVCDGSEYHETGAPVFNVAGRYLPNLTDDRFLMGSSVQGNIGGANSVQGIHTHTTGDHVLTVSEIPSHNHTATNSTGGGHTHSFQVWNSNDANGGNSTSVAQQDAYNSPGSATTTSNGSHSHTITVDSSGGGGSHNHGDTGAAGGTTDNRPKYLTCIYAIKVNYGAGPDVNFFEVQPE